MIEGYFERVNRFAEDESIHLPERKTLNAAGYDFEVAEDIVLPPFEQTIYNISCALQGQQININLEDLAAFTKSFKLRPTLVPTGVKCKMPDDCYLELTLRSSTPFKYWIIMANSVGVIDSDYYNADGEIFFQVINLFPYPIELKKGDIIGQGILKRYETFEEDMTNKETRSGGFGSTTK